MSKSLIKLTGSSFSGAGNITADVIYEGLDIPFEQRWQDVDNLEKPIKKTQTFLLLDDGTRVSLPVNAVPELLPDRGGVVVVFRVDSQGQPTDSLPADFPDVRAPHNAVIFNADGSVRCVINQRTKLGAYIQQTSTNVITQQTGPYGQPLGEPFLEPIVQFGVLVADHPSSSPDWFYELDQTTGDLIGTAKWKRY
jgi:hypothetical protein